MKDLIDKQALISTSAVPGWETPRLARGFEYSGDGTGVRWEGSGIPRTEYLSVGLLAVHEVIRPGAPAAAAPAGDPVPADVRAKIEAEYQARLKASKPAVTLADVPPEVRAQIEAESLAKANADKGTAEPAAFVPTPEPPPEEVAPRPRRASRSLVEAPAPPVDVVGA